MAEYYNLPIMSMVSYGMDVEYDTTLAHFGGYDAEYFHGV